MGNTGILLLLNSYFLLTFIESKSEKHMKSDISGISHKISVIAGKLREQVKEEREVATADYTEPRASQVALVVKNPPADAGDMSQAFDLWVGKNPWRRPLATHFNMLPGESPGQGSLAAAVPGIAKSQTQLKRFSTYAY